MQGAQGVGKTAVLAECARLARDAGWKVAGIEAKALYDPNAFRAAIGAPTVAYPTADGVSVFDPFGESVELVMHDHGAGGLLLVLEDAFTLAKAAAASNMVAAEMTMTLTAIHNSQSGEPVFLLAGGAEGVTGVFDELGIARFMGGCIVNMGGLCAEAEESVIRDWLVKDGNAGGDTDKWIKAIADNSQGWPQHIIAYVESAVEILAETGGVMTDEGLKETLRRGSLRKKEYFRSLRKGFSPVEMVDIAKSIKSLSSLSGWCDIQLVRGLEHGRTHEEAINICRRLRRAGIVAEQESWDYAIPIPSMEDWFVDYEHYLHDSDRDMENATERGAIGGTSD